jgi:hypothetical protein
VRHLGCGDCSYFSSREQHHRVLVFLVVFKLEQGYSLDCWSAWRLVLDDVNQPQKSCNIVASTEEWLVYISNSVLISKQWCFNFRYVHFCLTKMIFKPKKFITSGILSHIFHVIITLSYEVIVKRPNYKLYPLSLIKIQFSPLSFDRFNLVL